MPSTIDRELVGSLKLRGVEVSQRSARRWREDGLLPETVRSSRGRGGATFAYPEGITDHAAALKRLFENGHDKDHVCVLVFLEGFEPRLRALRSAFTRIVNEVFGQPADDETTRASADARARHMSRRAGTSPIGREAKDRLRRDGQAGLLGEVLVHTLGVLATGRGQVASETLVAFDLQQSPFSTVPRATISEPLTLLSPPRLLACVSEASLEEYRAVRATLMRLEAVVAVHARASRITGEHLGFRVVEAQLAEDSARVLVALLLLSLHDHPLGADLEHGLAQAEGELPRFEALFSLTDAMPQDWEIYLSPLGPQLLAAQPEAFQDRVHGVVVSWAAENPMHADLLMTTTD